MLEAVLATANRQKGRIQPSVLGGGTKIGKRFWRVILSDRARLARSEEGGDRNGYIREMCEANMRQRSP